jgi:general stress protein YciG
METKPKPRRGFACLSPERRREIARKGGASVKAENRSFTRNTALAATRPALLAGHADSGCRRPGAAC